MGMYLSTGGTAFDLVHAVYSAPKGLNEEIAQTHDKVNHGKQEHETHEEEQA